MESEAGYGVSTEESLAFYDRDTSSWRTYQLCFDEESTEFSGTWPSSGMVRNGKLFSRPTLGCRIVANASALLPTPTKSFGVNARGWGLSKTGRKRFSEQVQQNALRFGYRPPIDLLEWMMGFPENHTAIVPSALGTQLSRQPLNGLVEGSSNTISDCGVALTQSGMMFSRDLSYEEWENVGFEMARFNKSWQWCIGDWINYGEKKYGETYKAAIEATGLKRQSCENIALVCREFEISRRREISFTHHAEVQSLDPEQQDELLEMAERECRPASWVRKEVKAIKSRSDSEYEDVEEEPQPQKLDSKMSRLRESIAGLEVHELILVKSWIEERLN